MGKTATVEFAMRYPARTCNPHNVAHTPGGSSSGSAASVADFMVPLALGTQTGGSIIRPAAFCGVVGFKPTLNVINRAGVKSVADCRNLLQQVFTDYDVLLTPSAPGEAPRGLTTTGDSIFNRMWSALHVPAVTIPAFTGPSSLPIGLQLVGPWGSDHKVLACGEYVHRLLR